MCRIDCSTCSPEVWCATTVTFAPGMSIRRPSSSSLYSTEYGGFPWTFASLISYPSITFGNRDVIQTSTHVNSFCCGMFHLVADTPLIVLFHFLPGKFKIGLLLITFTINIPNSKQSLQNVQCVVIKFTKTQTSTENTHSFTIQLTNSHTFYPMKTFKALPSKLPIETHPKKTFKASPTHP